MHPQIHAQQAKRPSHKGIRPQRLNWGMEGVWEGTFLVAEDGELGGFSNMFDYHP